MQRVFSFIWVWDKMMKTQRGLLTLHSDQDVQIAPLCFKTCQNPPQSPNTQFVQHLGSHKMDESTWVTSVQLLSPGPPIKRKNGKRFLEPATRGAHGSQLFFSAYLEKGKCGGTVCVYWAKKRVRVIVIPAVCLCFTEFFSRWHTQHWAEITWKKHGPLVLQLGAMPLVHVGP